MTAVTDHYPNRAGYTEHSTSMDAAVAIEGTGRAARLRDKVQSALRYSGLIYTEGLTADEIAYRLGESPLSIRPRVAELHKQGLIEPTGERRKSSGGRPSHVWRLK